MTFSVFQKKKSGFWVFLVSVLLSASVKRCFVSRMRDFLTIHCLKFLFYLDDYIKPVGSFIFVETVSRWKGKSENICKENPDFVYSSWRIKHCILSQGGLQPQWWDSRRYFEWFFHLSPSHAILPGVKRRSQGSKAVSHRVISTLKKCT